MARTNRAKSKIRSRLNAEARRKSIEIGRKLLEKEAAVCGIPFRRVTSAPGLAAAMKHQGAATTEDLFAAIGYGKTPASRVLAHCFPGEKLAPADAEPGLSGALRRIMGRAAGQIDVSGHGDVLVQRAPCCSPVPGEAITGYLTRGKGVDVHWARCPQLTNLELDPERRVNVSWKAAPGTRFGVRFTLRTEDRKGMLADITKVIAEADADILAVEATADDAARGAIRVTVALENAREAGRVARTLQDVVGVIEVHRGRGAAPMKPESVPAATAS